MYARILCFVLAVALVSLCALAATPHIVLLSDVKTLTLYKDRMTVAGRGPAVKQIDCVGGDACHYFTPEVISCTNIGTDDRGEVQWECQAQMESYYRLGQIQVSCEGYSNPDDPYILSGSCGVEYTLHLTEQGKQYHAPKQINPTRIGIDEIHVRKESYEKEKQDRLDAINKARHTRFMEEVCKAAIVIVLLLIIAACICVCYKMESVPHHRHSSTTPPPASTYVPSSGFTYTPTAPTVIHHHSSSDSGFFSGFLAGESSARCRAPASHTHTTHVVTSPPVSSYSSSPSVSAPVSSPATTYTSSGFGGTKKR